MLLLLGIPVALFTYVTVMLIILHQVRGIDFSYQHAGTDLTFASSDGGWRGEEDMLYGHQFEDVLVDFELYRLRSGLMQVHLVRTKPWKEPYKWAWWFDRRRAAKWKVPYRPPDSIPTHGARLEPAPKPSPEQVAAARRAAEAYLLTLR